MSVGNTILKVLREKNPSKMHASEFLCAIVLSSARVNFYERAYSELLQEVMLG